MSGLELIGFRHFCGDYPVAVLRINDAVLPFTYDGVDSLIRFQQDNATITALMKIKKAMEQPGDYPDLNRNDFVRQEELVPGGKYTEAFQDPDFIQIREMDELKPVSPAITKDDDQFNLFEGK